MTKAFKISEEARFMSVKEIAMKMNCSEATLRRLIKRHGIAYLRIGRLRRYNVAHVVTACLRFDSGASDVNVEQEATGRFN